MGQRVPRNTGWSWSRLVGEYGLERAMTMLQHQPGLGQFAFTRPTNEQRGLPVAEDEVTTDKPWDEVHDELPAICPVPPWAMDERRFPHRLDRGSSGARWQHLTSRRAK